MPLAALLLFLAFPAWAQSHGWIQDEPRYQTAYGSHCCGPTHCLKRDPSYVREVRTGWLVPSTGQVFAEGVRSLYDSEDGDVWACVVNGLVVCLFVLPRGA